MCAGRHINSAALQPYEGHESQTGMKVAQHIWKCSHVTVSRIQTLQAASTAWTPV